MNHYLIGVLAIIGCISPLLFGVWLFERRVYTLYKKAGVEHPETFFGFKD
jgi:hypothetical protein